MGKIDLGSLIRKIELWNTGVSEKPLSVYLGMSEEDLKELLKLLGREK